MWHPPPDGRNRDSRVFAPVPASQAIEIAHLGRVQPRDHHVQAEVGVAPLGQQFDTGQDAIERPPPPDGVVGLGARAVQADLQVDRSHVEQSVDERVVEEVPFVLTQVVMPCS